MKEIAEEGNLNNGLGIGLVLIVWLVLSLNYFFHTPWDIRSHDTWTHIEYTEFVAEKHRLPIYPEIFQAVQPPLYYLINSFCPHASAPPGSDQKLKHINFIRLLSVFYGAISLLLIFWFLNEATNNHLSKLLVLIFIATTPKFIYMFTTYNNDSLATLLCIGTVVISYKLYLKWRWTLATLLLLFSIGALYTKYSSMICIGSIFMVLLIKMFLIKNVQGHYLKIITTLFFSVILLLPWTILHNYNHTHKYCPSMFGDTLSFFNKDRYKNILGYVLRISKLQEKKPDYTHEWDDPFVHPSWDYINPATKLLQ